VTELVNLSETTVIKAGNAFCIALRDGRLPLDGDHPLGVYLNDCRHLSGHELWLGGRHPRLLIATDAAGTAAVFELTNPDLPFRGGELPLQSLRVRVERRMLPSAMVERITVRSHAREPAELELELRVDADFKPMQEVRELVPPTRREIRRQPLGNALRFVATGLDGRDRSTLITCSGAVAAPDGRFRVRQALAPGEALSIEVSVELAQQGAASTAASSNGRVTGAASMADAAAEADAWLADHAEIEVDEELVDRVLRRSLLDLRLLTSEYDGHRYYAAGVPWYATLFGRDSIIAAMQAIPFDRAMAEETLCLLREHAAWTGSLDLFRELRAPVEAALEWIDRYGDLDDDGLLEYRRRSAAGLENQGWKDSWDGVPDEHGIPLRAPIALVEAQGYAMAAKRGVARLFEVDGDAARAQELRAGADTLAAGIERFWLAEEGFYAMALDAEKRPSRALASNQGQLLWALAVAPERGAAIRDALMGDGAYSGWGVRTLGSEERAFNPVGYHTGTVWPHDNALFAVGLRRYGFDKAFLRVFEGLIDAAASFPDYRLPELFAGFSRADYEDPVPYPVACSPQAWAAGSLPSMLIAGLGLAPDGLGRTLRIRRPSLPRHINRLRLHGLRVADARVSMSFERVANRADSVALTDAQVDGDLDVVLEISRAGDPALAPDLERVRSESV
jgi:glycogen debranching enzyme